MFFFFLIMESYMYIAFSQSSKGLVSILGIELARSVPHDVNQFLVRRIVTVSVLLKGSIRKPQPQPPLQPQLHAQP